MKATNNYPAIGDTFYWKDEDGNIQDDICLKIEHENDLDIETMYFTYISPNGGGYFITESDIINPSTVEVKNYKKEKAKEKILQFIKDLEDNDYRNYISNVLGKIVDKHIINDMLNSLSNPEQYNL